MASATGGQSFVQRIDRRTIILAASIYFIALFLSLMPPFFQFFNRSQPQILGFSFVLFWVFFSTFLMAVGLIVLYQIEKVRGEVV